MQSLYYDIAVIIVSGTRTAIPISYTHKYYLKSKVYAFISATFIIKHPPILYEKHSFTTAWIKH